jgi:23S rRNA pseudouridine1911/1915/1917 synthase
MSQISNFDVIEEKRLDLFLVDQLNQSRNQISQLIKQNAIYVDEKVISKPGLKLKIDQKVKVIFPDAKESKALKVNFDIEILYEDDDLLVINKPSGVTVHPAPSVKEATLVDWLKHKGIRLSTISGEERHGIVHRLDKGTSGTMVVAKNNETHEALSLQLQDKSMGRYYIAVIEPPLKEDLITIDKAIGRSSTNRLKMACIDGAKEAKTDFKKLLLSNNEDQELIACKLYSGRTHQIRVHLESMSRHIIGDHIYGTSKRDAKMERILLHAYILYFIHPTTKNRVQFVANVPDEITDYINKYFDMESFNETINTDRFEQLFNDSAL